MRCQSKRWFKCGKDLAMRRPTGNRHFVVYRNINLWALFALTKAWADPNRGRMFLALQRSELCVCQTTELIGLASATVSKHLSLLQRAGLVQSRKAER